MPGREPFAYALIRIVPRAERGESVNAGVLLFSRRRGYLALRWHLPTERLAALDPTADVQAIEAHLRTLELIAAGDPAAGPVAEQSPSARFHWLVAPTSTVVQPSAVHTGLLTDPGLTLERLFEALAR